MLPDKGSILCLKADQDVTCPDQSCLIKRLINKKNPLDGGVYAESAFYLFIFADLDW